METMSGRAGGEKPLCLVGGLPILLGEEEPKPAGRPSPEEVRLNGRLLPLAVSGGDDRGEYSDRDREDVETEAASSSDEESAPGYLKDSA